MKPHKLTTQSKSKRAVNRRASQNKNSGNQLSGSLTAMTCPVFRPIHKFSRTVEELYDVSTDGVNPTLAGFNFSLDVLPDYTDFTNLFDMFRITKVEIEWLPEYTELTDAALISNAVNIRFNSAIDLTNSTAPSTVNEILQFEQLKSTSITKPHSRSWQPTFLMSGLVPCKCWLPCAGASSQAHLGIKVAIPPSGVAMVFRSKVKLHIECANVN